MLITPRTIFNAPNETAPTSPFYIYSDASAYFAPTTNIITQGTIQGWLCNVEDLKIQNKYISLAHICWFNLFCRGNLYLKSSATTCDPVGAAGIVTINNVEVYAGGVLDSDKPGPRIVGTVHAFYNSTISTGITGSSITIDPKYPATSGTIISLSAIGF